MIQEIALELIDLSPFQTRRNVSPIPSIEKLGVIQPLLIRPKPNSERYELVVGHRRLETLRRLGKEKALCEVRQLSDEEAATIHFTENEDREGLTDAEKGEYFIYCMKRFEFSESQLARKLGISHSLISLCVGVAQSLGPVVIRITDDKPDLCHPEELYKGAVSANKYAIAGQVLGQRNEVLSEVVRENLSTRETKALVSLVKAGSSIPSAAATVVNAKRAPDSVKRALELGRTSSWWTCPICDRVYLMSHLPNEAHSLSLLNGEDSK